MPAPAVTTLHFDLSHAPEDSQHTLHLAGKDYILQSHTPQTRTLHAAANPLLAAVPDNLQHRISHFAEDVALPETVAMMFVQHPSKDPNSPLPALSLIALHIPQAADAAASGQASQPAQNLANSKLKAMGAPLLGAAAPTDVAVTDDQAGSLKTPLDAAITLVSMHPELMHFDPATAAHIHDTHIAPAPGITDLALSISEQGAADTDGGWATILPCVDINGTVLTDDSGKPVYHYELSDDTKTVLSAPVKGALRSSKDDSSLKNKVWGQNYSVTSIDHSAPSLKAAAPAFAGQVTTPTGVSETPQPTPPTAKDNRWTPTSWSSVYGLNLGNVQPDPGAPDTYTIDVTNNALRHVSTYVDFLDDTGTVIAGKRQTLSLLAPGNFLMGIPISTDSTQLSFKMPDNVSGARIYFGTLGTGEFDSDVAGIGLYYTALFEMAVPTFMLAAGVWKSEDNGYADLWKDRNVLIAIGTLATVLLSQELCDRIVSDPAGSLILIGNSLMSTLLKAAIAKLRAYIIQQLAETEAEKYIPFIGFALAVVGVASTLAQLAETTAAVIETPSVNKLDIFPTMTLTVNVLPDPLHSVWPSVSRKYRLMVQYQGGTFMHLDGEMSEFTKGVTSSTQVSKDFTNVPARGQIKVYAVIYSDNWWICGYASSANWETVLQPSGGTYTVSLTITEQLVPLTSSTRYSHNEKLIYDAINGHQWKGGTDTAPLAAPTQTKANLDDTASGNKLAELVNITINDHAHVLGYCWRASGQGIPFVGDTTPSEADMYAFQNISYLASPESGLKATNRGLTSKPNILYDQFGPIEQGATDSGNNFYLDVVDEVYHLRRVDFDATPFDLTAKPLSWGKFTQPHLDSVVVHPGGYVAAASWENSKLEILTIPSVALADDDSKLAVAKLCSGQGLQEGLLNGPMAMAVTPDGMLLVLETTNARIQAFDVTGAPVQAFDSTAGKLSYMPLKTQTGTVTYLDIGTESKGYIYVLSYLGAGESQTDYNLDIYEPTGTHLCTTNGLNAAKIVVSMWRDVYALNYEVLLGPNNRTEPSISQWIPSTPPGTDPNA